jgi:predicted metal-dependent phosphoesterase TrpH
MPRVNKEALTPGMKLAKPICGQNGMVMLTEGTELTEKWIERIQDMDISGVFVEGSREPKISREEALTALEERFPAVLQGPYMAEIKKAVRLHIESLYD